MLIRSINSDLKEWMTSTELDESINFSDNRLRTVHLMLLYQDETQDFVDLYARLLRELERLWTGHLHVWTQALQYKSQKHTNRQRIENALVESAPAIERRWGARESIAGALAVAHKWAPPTSCALRRASGRRAIVRVRLPACPTDKRSWGCSNRLSKGRDSEVNTYELNGDDEVEHLNPRVHQRGAGRSDTRS